MYALNTQVLADSEQTTAYLLSLAELQFLGITFPYAGPKLGHISEDGPQKRRTDE